MKQVLETIVVAMFAVLMTFAFTRSCQKEPQPIPNMEKADTVRIVDTILIDQFREVTKKVVDTMLVAVNDTLRLYDTTFISLPIEQKHYVKDSVVEVWVSGYKPNLDSVKVFKTITTITQPVVKYKKRKVTVGVGLQTGIGYVSPIGGSGGIGTYAGIGVGLQYTF